MFFYVDFRCSCSYWSRLLHCSLQNTFTMEINLQKLFVITRGLQKQFCDLESGCISMYSTLFSWIAVERPVLPSTEGWMNNQRSCDKVLALPRLSALWYVYGDGRLTHYPTPRRCSSSSLSPKTIPAWLNPPRSQVDVASRVIKAHKPPHHVNSLIPKSDQHQISPCNINAL